MGVSLKVPGTQLRVRPTLIDQFQIPINQLAQRPLLNTHFSSLGLPR